MTRARTAVVIGLVLSMAGSAAGQEAPGLFDSDSVFSLTLTANWKAVRKDKGTKHPYHSGALSYSGPGDTVSLPVRVRTRGIFRLKNCSFPPIRLNLSKSGISKTIFAKHDKPKLVTHCEDNKDYEQYVLQEYLIYRAYNLLTPLSLRARLARVTYVDSADGKPVTTRYGILLEEESSMAARNGGKVTEVKGARGDDLDPFQTALVSVLQYMVGNTDWSVSALHNIQLVQANLVVYPVAFDFDWSGAIGTRYARPDPQLGTRSVQERVFGGYCVPADQFERVFALFAEKKDSIYALYGTVADLDPDHVKRTREYFDEFYRTIGDSRRAKRALIEACRPS